MHQTLLPAALALAIVSPLATAQPFAPKPVRGDLNSDGVVDATDLAVMIDLLSDPTGENPAREHADLTGDGKVDELDITAILEVLNRGAGHPLQCDGSAPCCYELLPVGCCGTTTCLVKDSDGGGDGPGGIGGGGGGTVPGGDPGDPNNPNEPNDPPNDPCSYVLCIRDADDDYISLTQVLVDNILYGIDDVTVYAVEDPDAPTPVLVDVLWYLIGDAGEDLDESAAPSSSYTLSAAPGVWNGPGEYLLGTRCDNDAMTDKGGPTVILYSLRPKAVTFGGGNHIIYPDNPMDPEPHNAPYDEHHWYDHNGDGVTDDDLIANPAEHDGYTTDRRLPVAYTRNTAMTIDEFVPLVDAGEDPVGTPYPGPGAFFYRAIRDDPGGGEPTVFEGAFPGTPGGAVADAALPDHIAYLPFMQLRWEVSFDGEHLWFPIGTTNHEVYVTLDTPTGQRLESMYHIAVLSAQGETTANDALDATWAEFASLSVQNKKGQTLGYYRGAGCPDPPATTARPLIIDRNGQCGAWVELLAHCIFIHGSRTVFQTLIEPNPNQFNYQCDPVLALQNAWQPTLRILITHWMQVNNPSSGCITFPNRVNSVCQAWQPWLQVDIDDIAGLPGQDQADPISIFGSHILVRVGSLYYDPSYGSGPYPSVLDWENASVAGYAARIDNNSLRRGATPDAVDWQQVTEMDEPISVEAE